MKLDGIAKGTRFLFVVVSALVVVSCSSYQPPAYQPDVLRNQDGMEVRVYWGQIGYESFERYSRDVGCQELTHPSSLIISGAASQVLERFHGSPYQYIDTMAINSRVYVGGWEMNACKAENKAPLKAWNEKLKQDAMKVRITTRADVTAHCTFMSSAIFQNPDEMDLREWTVLRGGNVAYQGPLSGTEGSFTVEFYDCK